MFALFFSLYYSMFYGKWHLFNIGEIGPSMKAIISKLGELLTSIFGEFQVTNFGDTFFEEIQITGTSGPYYLHPYLGIFAFILALITCIGIVVMAVKGIKRVFGVFFMGIRNI